MRRKRAQRAETYGASSPSLENDPLSSNSTSEEDAEDACQRYNCVFTRSHTKYRDKWMQKGEK